MLTMEENMESGRKLALLGASSNIYKAKLQEVIDRDRCGYVWSGWTYQLHDDKKRILDEQISKDGFRLYVHITKKPSKKRRNEGATRGSGLVEYCLIVKHYKYYPDKARSPKPECSVKDGVVDETITPHRLWAQVDKIEPIQYKSWNILKDFDTGEYLKGNFKLNIPDVYFGYIDDSSIN